MPDAFPDNYNPELDDQQRRDEEEGEQPEDTAWTDTFRHFSEAFDKLCQERHDMGQKEYGPFTFLGNDVIRMMAEELADTANYCRYQFVKLMLLERMLQDQLDGVVQPDSDGNVTIGLKSFKGVGEVGW